MKETDWIAVDWGTSNLRAWAIKDDRVVDSAQAASGMGQLRPDEFEPALLDVVANWLPASGQSVPVLACGMVGARQGWTEAPYRVTPCPPLAPESARAPTSDARLNVHIIGGICQHNPADVMRGEETQIAGLLSTEPMLDAVVCMPGTHTKWVRVQDRQIIAFRSVMTGEAFALLASQSILRHSVGEPTNDAQSSAQFRQTLQQLASKNESGLMNWFSVRADHLLHDTPANTLRARLSACLIFDEVCAARSLWPDVPVVLLGTPELSWMYQQTLAINKISARLTDASDLTLRGLRQYRTLKLTDRP